MTRFSRVLPWMCFIVAVAFLPLPLFADNCSGGIDCYGSVAGAAAAAAAIGGGIAAGVIGMGAGRGLSGREGPPIDPALASLPDYPSISQRDPNAPIPSGIDGPPVFDGFPPGGNWWDDIKAIFNHINKDLEWQRYEEPQHADQKPPELPLPTEAPPWAQPPPPWLAPY